MEEKNRLGRKKMLLSSMFDLGAHTDEMNKNERK
jgi:hypothetical protein